MYPTMPLHLWLLVLSPWLSLFSVIFAVLHSFEKEHFYPWMFLCGSTLLYLLNCAIVIYSFKKKKKKNLTFHTGMSVWFSRSVESNTGFQNLVFLERKDMSETSCIKISYTVISTAPKKRSVFRILQSVKLLTGWLRTDTK